MIESLVGCEGVDHRVDASAFRRKVLCGTPGYINLLDALNAWQLVRELASATGATLPALIQATMAHTLNQAFQQ